MINSVCGIRSTGRVCTDLAEVLVENGYEVKIAYGRETVPEKYQKYAVRIGTDIDNKIHVIQTRLFDTHGFGYGVHCTVECYNKEKTAVVCGYAHCRGVYGQCA